MLHMKKLLAFRDTKLWYIKSIVPSCQVGKKNLYFALLWSSGHSDMLLLMITFLFKVIDTCFGKRSLILNWRTKATTRIIVNQNIPFLTTSVIMIDNTRYF